MQAANLSSLVVADDPNMREHLSLQDLSCILDTLLPGDSNCGTSLANIVKSHLQK